MIGEDNGWEAVHTVHDYYDGPLTGAADFEGRPHAYSRIFDEKAGDWSSEFMLRPITGEQLLLVKEDHAMFLRWRAAHDAAKLGPDDAHPVLAAERQRHGEIAGRVEDALSIDPAGAIRAFAEFKRAVHPVTHDGALWVRWTAAA